VSQWGPPFNLILLAKVISLNKVLLTVSVSLEEWADTSQYRAMCVHEQRAWRDADINIIEGIWKVAGNHQKLQ